MKEKLETAPNDEVQFVDEEAEILFLELGFIDIFIRHAPNGRARQVVIFAQHVTHWIVAVYDGRSSNGFEARCFPKLNVPLLTFQMLAVQLLDPAPEAAVRRVDGVPIPEFGAETLPLFEK
jgi:hypothetical protein